MILCFPSPIPPRSSLSSYPLNFMFFPSVFDRALDKRGHSPWRQSWCHLCHFPFPFLLVVCDSRERDEQPCSSIHYSHDLSLALTNIRPHADQRKGVTQSWTGTSSGLVLFYTLRESWPMQELKFIPIYLYQSFFEKCHFKLKNKVYPKLNAMLHKHWIMI